MIRYIHGSQNSVDIDTIYVFEEEPLFKEAKEFCDSKKDENANIICIENGIVSYCYKGTKDEVNNSLLATYPLHEQEYPLLIDRKVERNKYLKLIRAIRGIISQFSRTDIREIIKKGLNGNWDDRMEALKIVAYGLRRLCTADSGIEKKRDISDVLKTIAFQVGQTLALIDKGERGYVAELYTKDEISNRYPDLKGYLERETTDVSLLKSRLCNFLRTIRNIDYYYVGDNLIRFTSDPNSYVYDLKTEKVNGVLEYDIKVGDIFTTYHPNFGNFIRIASEVDKNTVSFCCSLNGDDFEYFPFKGKQPWTGKRTVRPARPREKELLLERLDEEEMYFDIETATLKVREN